MRKFVYLLLIFVTACGGDTGLDDSSSSNASGLYAAPILDGDYVEKPATSIVINVDGGYTPDNTLIELSPNKPVFVEAVLQPVSVKNASFFESISMQKKFYCNIIMPYKSV